MATRASSAARTTASSARGRLALTTRTSAVGSPSSSSRTSSSRCPPRSGSALRWLGRGWGHTRPSPWAASSGSSRQTPDSSGDRRRRWACLWAPGGRSCSWTVGSETTASWQGSA
eukprot:11571818-Heterocapsa_arctica.AAC.1